MDSIRKLLLKHLRGDLDDAGKQQLDTWRRQDKHNQELFESVENRELMYSLVEKMHQFNEDNTLEKIRQQSSALQTYPIHSRTHRVHFLRTAWFRYAAVIILILTSVAYLWNNNLKVKTENLKIVQADPVERDVAPGSNKAILTLADGTKNYSG